MVISNTELSAVTRCPACGQRIEESALERCPLCGLDFGVDRTATSDDTTPFAEAYSHEMPGHGRMLKWIWTAPAGRIKHLALMRTSAAARAFSRRYLLLLAGVLGLLLATHHGWRAVSASPGIEARGSTKPQGRGWLHVAATPNPYRATAAPGTPVDLWWNAPQAVIAGVAGFVSGLLLLWIVFASIRAGVQAAHRSSYRGDGRMTAALHYSTAWSVPLLIAGLLLVLRSVSRVGDISRWGWSPSRYALELMAGMVAGVTLIFWWFWFLRLGSAAPADTRVRVEWFFGLGTPLIAAGGAAAWWLGLNDGLTHLFDWWKLGF